MSRGPIIDTGLVDALRGGMQGGISLASLLSHIEDQKRQAEMEHQRLLMDQAWRQSQESIQKDRNAIDREQLAETARGHDLQALDREADNKRAEGVIKDRQQQYQEKRTDQTNANRSTLAMAGVQPTTTAMMPFGGAGTGLPTMPMPVQQDNPEYQQGLMADPQILAQQMKDQIEEVRRQSKVAKGVNLLNRAHQNKMPAYMVAMRDDMGNPVPLDTYLAGLGHPLEPEDVNPHAREAYLRGIDMMGPSAYSVMGSGKAPPAAMMREQMTPEQEAQTRASLGRLLGPEAVPTAAQDIMNVRKAKIPIGVGSANTTGKAREDKGKSSANAKRWEAEATKIAAELAQAKVQAPADMELHSFLADRLAQAKANADLAAAGDVPGPGESRGGPPSNSERNPANRGVANPPAQLSKQDALARAKAELGPNASPADVVNRANQIRGGK